MASLSRMLVVALLAPLLGIGGGLVFGPAVGVLTDRFDRRRLIVIADNCTDATADIARDAGAEVIERTAPDNRGKGFGPAVTGGCSVEDAGLEGDHAAGFTG